ncbi:hypothetical protein RFI_04119, partial [Reticulomyxa filosa]
MSKSNEKKMTSLQNSDHKGESQKNEQTYFAGIKFYFYDDRQWSDLTLKRIAILKDCIEKHNGQIVSNYTEADVVVCSQFTSESDAKQILEDYKNRGNKRPQQLVTPEWIAHSLRLRQKASFQLHMLPCLKASPLSRSKKESPQQSCSAKATTRTPYIPSNTSEKLEIEPPKTSKQAEGGFFVV